MFHMHNQHFAWNHIENDRRDQSTCATSSKCLHLSPYLLSFVTKCLWVGASQKIINFSMLLRLQMQKHLKNLLNKQIVKASVDSTSIS